jgi:hypothetical protein
MTKKYVTIAFAAELANQQKEQVFNLLLGSRLVSDFQTLNTFKTSSP